MISIVTWQRRVFLTTAAIVIGGVLLGLSLPEVVQVYLLAALVILLGLPHGALDPLVAHRAGLWKNARGFAVFILKYLSLASAALIAWMLAPGPALLAFLLYSGYHFSGDWREELPVASRLAAGLFVISVPSAMHGGLTSGIFAVLAGEANASWIIPVMQAVAVPAAIGLALVVLFQTRTLALRLELTALFAAGILLPPLLFFILYFCALHSPRHLIQAASGESVPIVVATAIAFTLLTVALAAHALSFVGSADLPETVIRFVFIGLATLTVPHMVLVEARCEN